MNRFRSLLTGKMLIPAASLALGIGFYVSTLPTTDAVIGPYVCSYYSSANYKTVVGARGNGCCGSVINWGITTSFKKCQTLYCTDQVCPN